MHDACEGRVRVSLGALGVQSVASHPVRESLLSQSVRYRGILRDTGRYKSIGGAVPHGGTVGDFFLFSAVVEGTLAVAPRCVY